MARRIHIFADFDWLTEVELVGVLSYERIRGYDSYGFEFDRDWLRKHSDIQLGDDLQNYPGIQYTKPGRDVFGCFSDALPDRWGRTLLARREQLEAALERRPVKRLTSFDLLLGIDDISRMGGFRFKDSPEGEFINAQDRFKIPPLTDIRSLMAASEEVEICEARSYLPEKRWIEQLVRPGSSLGGARPKANVFDEKGALCVAKFPSLKDDVDVAAWENFAHVLAREAGVNSAETRVIGPATKHHALLSKRFDRLPDGKRVHFASAMTLLGLTDGDGVGSGHGYLDIVDFIIQGCCDVENNLRELFRRVAFNICIGNSDDHFRNHGFLLTRKGWTLSPAYDMNPTLDRHQSLLISRDSNQADLDVLLNACEDYLVPRAEAAKMIQETRRAVAGWRSVAKHLQLPQREILQFAGRFD